MMSTVECLPGQFALMTAKLVEASNIQLLMDLSLKRMSILLGNFPISREMLSDTLRIASAIWKLLVT